MRHLVLSLLLICFSVCAGDNFMSRWKDRVNDSENPMAKAHDMCSDWVFDHRKKLQALDPETLARGEQIAQWMNAQGYGLPEKVEDLYATLHLRMNLEVQFADAMKDHGVLKIDVVEFKQRHPVKHEASIISDTPQSIPVAVPDPLPSPEFEVHTTSPSTQKAAVTSSAPGTVDPVTHMMTCRNGGQCMRILDLGYRLPNPKHGGRSK